MKPRKAILYVRVSTDEQADKGHSLAHQEEKLRSFCSYNNMEIIGFYKEDHSAKSFERPQFRMLLDFLKKNKGKADTLLFLKWDRFSRNAPEAYGMISTLAKLGVEPQAAEQPLNLEVPEQKIMLALYLTAPEVENDRRAMNVFAGMRRAMKEGRQMGKAPYGYKNGRCERNRPRIVPSDDAPLVQLSFEMMATGQYHIEQLRKIVNDKGLKATKNTFWTMLRHPVYMGKVQVAAHKDEPAMLVHGLHEALVSEALYYEVQDVLDGKKRKPTIAGHETSHEELPLRGFLKCAKCGGNLTGSAANGHGGKYYYYHCRKGCKERFRADAANANFEALLERISGNKKVLKSFELILTDSFKKDGTGKEAELKKIAKELATLQGRLRNAETLMLDGEIKASDYNGIKTRLEPEIARLIRQQTSLDSSSNREEREVLEFGFYFLSNCAKLFKDAALEQKRRIIGSTFPEKLVFENGECRTYSEDSFMALISRTGKDSTKKKDGDNSENCSPSCHVVAPGLEPRITEPKSVVLPLHHATDSWRSANVNPGRAAAKKFFAPPATSCPSAGRIYRWLSLRQALLSAQPYSLQQEGLAEHPAPYGHPSSCG